jgi:hypothetical protein
MPISTSHAASDIKSSTKVGIKKIAAPANNPTAVIASPTFIEISARAS